MNQNDKNEQTKGISLPKTFTSDLRGRQSVRATFKLSEGCIEAISIVAAHLGIKQKSLFDHLVEDARFLTSIAREIQNVVPMAEVVQLETISQFFENPPEPMDVLLTSAEGGSAWTLIHPSYTVVNPQSRPEKIPISYPYAGPDLRFEKFLEHWIQLRRSDGTVEDLYDYWILGRGAADHEPRWSVIRDVLKWVD